MKRDFSQVFIVYAGLEPKSFRILFPFWEDRPEVSKINQAVSECHCNKEFLEKEGMRFIVHRWSCHLLWKATPFRVKALNPYALLNSNT